MGRRKRERNIQKGRDEKADERAKARFRRKKAISLGIISGDDTKDKAKPE